MCKLNSIKSLLVLWENKIKKQYFHVGTLYFDGMCYTFQYTYQEDSPRNVKAALQNGYRLHPVFSILEKAYKSNSLFATFDRRIPSDDRVNYSEILLDLGLPMDANRMDILRETRGILSGDAYSFEEPLLLHQNRHLETNFYVNGMRHRNSADDWLSQVQIGDGLVAVLEPDNEWNSIAVRLETKNGLHLGYIPAVYVEAVKSLIENGIDVNLKVIDIRPKSAPQWWIHVGLYCELKIGEKYILKNKIFGGLILKTV